MKRIYTFLIICFCGCILALAQVGTQNYVRTRTMLKEDGTKYMDQIQYVDGLGRPFQHVQKAITHAGSKNLITLQEYDAANRESHSWLPVVSTSDYLAPATAKSQAPASNGNDSRPYSQVVYEPSPLNRTKQQYGPGAAWASKPTSADYLYNVATGSAPLQVYNYSVNSSGNLVNSGYYPAQQLRAIRQTDEDGNISYTFTDNTGKTVLTRQVSNATTTATRYDTYYVYDDRGQLRYVLPPLAADALTSASSWTPTNADIKNYAYIYKYDGLGRCIEKKLPGCEPVKYVYDRANRMIFSQDGEQASTNQWTFYLYDALGRQVLQGICTNTNTASVANSVVTTTFTGSNTGIGGSGYSSSFALTSPTLHQVNYYDNYDFRNLTGFNNANFPAESVNAKGMLTGSVTTVLDTSTKLYSANYYDISGRLVNSISSNHVGGYDKTTTTYTFTGKPKTVTMVHTGKSTQTQVYTYNYDHAERLTTVTHKLNTGGVVTLVNNTYDDLGRLQKNSRNGVTTLADSYAYNVRSWVTRISGNQFTEDLIYKMNGNIATMQWNTGGQTRKYTYNYDALSRLTSAAYAGATAAEKYNTAYTYDKHGNIKALQRYGKTAAGAYGLVDNLTMSHTGNQLTNVTDAGVNVSLAESNDFKKGSTVNPGYAYNKNGAMTKDLNKKISAISYNSLSLPKSVVINGVTHTYTYAADGRKLKVKQGTSERDYVGSIIYEGNTLKRILIEGGYIEGGVYYFNFNDHLGNVRTVANSSGTAIQRDHYYPFGLPMAETASAEQDKQPYKYNGKEFERANGLNLYDYGARHYDAALGRFTTMDPLAEKYYSISPYAYCANNPMRFIDPDGRDIVIWYDNDKKYFIFNGSNHKNAPNNNFVSSVINAYDYDVKNGGGKSLQEIVTNKKYKVSVQESNIGSQFIREENKVIFNPVGALKLDDGNVLSPATILEHEFGHVVDHKNKTVDFTPDSKYTHASEKKIILGVELDTAKANGELPKNHPGRKSHSEGKRIIVENSTSTKEVNEQKSQEYRDRHQKFTEKRMRKWTSE